MKLPHFPGEVFPYMNYNLGQKVLRILHFLGLLTGHPPCEFGTMVTPPPPPLPGQCCLVGSKNVLATLQHCFFGGGGGGSILSEPGCRGKYSKIIHTTCIFLTFLSKTVDRHTPSNRLWFFSVSTLKKSIIFVLVGAVFTV